MAQAVRGAVLDADRGQVLGLRDAEDSPGEGIPVAGGNPGELRGGDRADQGAVQGAHLGDRRQVRGYRKGCSAAPSWAAAQRMPAPGGRRMRRSSSPERPQVRGQVQLRVWAQGGAAPA